LPAPPPGAWPKPAERSALVTLCVGVGQGVALELLAV
jgi:hypothetical protein